jgi:uncharacterized damage-inducible protein DinB
MVNVKDLLIEARGREFETTKRVLAALPQGKEDFRPHERSMTAKELAWLFVQEEKLGHGFLQGEAKYTGEKGPATIREIIPLYERAFAETTKLLKGMTEEELEGTAEFWIAPKTKGPVKKLDFLWMMHSDAIHHRGQFSVYIRMAGGKVPSIYGPSADEPWT